MNDCHELLELLYKLGCQNVTSKDVEEVIQMSQNIERRRNGNSN